MAVGGGIFERVRRRWEGPLNRGQEVHWRVPEARVRRHVGRVCAPPLDCPGERGFQREVGEWLVVLGGPPARRERVGGRPRVRPFVLEERRGCGPRLPGRFRSGCSVRARFQRRGTVQGGRRARRVGAVQSGGLVLLKGWSAAPRRPPGRVRDG